MEQGRLRLEEALSSKRIPFHETGMTSLKYAYLMSYVYARMLVSALSDRRLILAYANAEARRSTESLSAEGTDGMVRMAAILGIQLSYDGESFSMGFESYLRSSPNSKSFSLLFQDLSEGKVYFGIRVAMGLLRKAISTEIGKNLPIPKKSLPAAVIEYSKTVSIPEEKLTEMPASSEGKYLWIEKLLSTPIPDVRHRTVNLILAPYFVNVLKIGEREATNAIIKYIEKCKELEPNTKVDASYIRYQCRYSKNKRMKPLSEEKARELLGGMVSI